MANYVDFTDLFNFSNKLNLDLSVLATDEYILNTTDIIRWTVLRLNEEGMKARLDTEYSGRGMYGRSTMAIVVDSDIGHVNATIRNVILEYRESMANPESLDVDSLMNEISMNSIDNMGKSFVIYRK